MKNFLEKDLETIIWENYERCAEKGLNLDQQFFKYGKSYRQLNLAPYGIADLIYIHYATSEPSWHVQILELKRGKIDLAAYQQAKRYQTAVHALLQKSRSAVEQERVPIYFTTVLIGSEIETAGDFVYVFNYDPSCRAFTYSYGFDGIAFEEVGKDWRHDGDISVPGTVALALDWASHRTEATQHYALYQAEIAERAAEVEKESLLLYGDDTKALLITADGVLYNEDWLSLPEREEDAAQ